MFLVASNEPLLKLGLGSTSVYVYLKCFSGGHKKLKPNSECFEISTKEMKHFEVYSALLPNGSISSIKTLSLSHCPPSISFFPFISPVLLRTIPLTFRPPSVSFFPFLSFHTPPPHFLTGSHYGVLAGLELTENLPAFAF